MKKRSLTILLLIFIILLFSSSCDYGSSNLIYTLPAWIHGEHYTDTADAARDEASVGEKYFVGIKATSNSLTFIYREKSEGNSASDDKLVDYPYEKIPSKINSNWRPGLPDNMYPDLIRIAAYPEGSSHPAASMSKEHSKTLEGDDLIVFRFNPEGIGGFRILK